MDEDIFGAPVAVEDELRPPESWPGAAGQKSVAPDVPAWPSGPIHLAPEGNKTRQRRPAKKASNPTPGGSWPGAEPQPVSKPSVAQAQQPETRRSRKQATNRSHDQRGRAALSWAFLLLIAGAALVAWVALDDQTRILQLAGSLLLLIAAVVVGFIALRRR